MSIDHWVIAPENYHLARFWGLTHIDTIIFRHSMYMYVYIYI